MRHGLSVMVITAFVTGVLTRSLETNTTPANSSTPTTPPSSPDDAPDHHAHPDRIPARERLRGVLGHHWSARSRARSLKPGRLHRRLLVVLLLSNLANRTADGDIAGLRP
jgi:hypothetical protein